jgi:hypothetical protein
LLGGDRAKPAISWQVCQLLRFTVQSSQKFIWRLTDPVKIYRVSLRISRGAHRYAKMLSKRSITRHVLVSEALSSFLTLSTSLGRSGTPYLKRNVVLCPSTGPERDLSSISNPTSKQHKFGLYSQSIEEVNPPQLTYIPKEYPPGSPGAVVLVERPLTSSLTPTVTLKTRQRSDRFLRSARPAPSVNGPQLFDRHQNPYRTSLLGKIKPTDMVLNLVCEDYTPVSRNDAFTCSYLVDSSFLHFFEH